MDQLIAFGGGAINDANARSMLGTIDRGHVGKLVDAISRGDGAALLAEVRELDRDAPDYDRALVDLATLLQRIAIVQIVPEAAPEDEEFDSALLTRLARAISPEDAQLYYQIALAGRRDLNMAPEPRIGFEMTLLRMLAFRPDTAAQPSKSISAARTVPVISASPARSTSPASSTAPASSASQPSSASPASSGSPAVGAGPVVSAGPVASAAPVVEAARLISIDAANWPAVVEAAALSGMVRQLALNCVPAGFEHNLLTLKLDQAAADRRTRPIEEKFVQGLSKYLGRDIRLAFEVAESELNSPARQRVQAEQDRMARAASAFETDPAVKGLRERFGADVDAASVKPSN
jgi:DNA polymerase-3 subunit gamma/tau